MSFITNGLTLDNINQLGGIKGLWVLGQTSGSTVSPTITSYAGFTTTNGPSFHVPSQGVTGIGASSIGGTGTWYYFAVARDVSKYDETATVNGDNGSLFYAGTLATEIQHSNLTNEQTLQLLSQNRYLKMIYLDVNGNYFAVGFDRGASVKSIVKSTGQKPGDASDYKVTFTTNELNPAYQFTTDITTAMKTNNFIIQPCTNW